VLKIEWLGIGAALSAETFASTKSCRAKSSPSPWNVVFSWCAPLPVADFRQVLEMLAGVGLVFGKHFFTPFHYRAGLGVIGPS
jgi:hypothetical protein